MMRQRGILLSFSLLLVLSGCMSANQHYRNLGSTEEREMTVGAVQQEITRGMSGAEVAEVLGSPNIVTTDEQGREVWVYDKISTDVSYSRSSVGGVAGGLVVGGDAAGVAGANAGYSSGASSKTQRTLTVVIKFDEKKKVRDFAYHASRF
jgi:outer membrane protein assembly factor BamE (lipoprotein component of BamABCDE complex)